nr:serine/arginine repetitive matrix protein 1-like isoform X2 [Saimiri boliviensis boliviensis]
MASAEGQGTPPSSGEQRESGTRGPADTQRSHSFTTPPRRDARHSRRVIQRHRSVPQPHNADGAHNTTHGSTWMCRHTRTQKAEEPARRDPRPHGRYATTPPRAPCTLPQTPAPARSGAQGPPRAPRGAHDPDASRPDTGTPSAATAAAPGPGARLTETRGFLPAGEPAACAV